MTPTLPAESSFSPSFIYPVKSLLSGIQPHQPSQLVSPLGLSSPDAENDAITPGESSTVYHSTRSVSTGTAVNARSRRSKSLTTFSFEESTASNRVVSGRETRKFLKSNSPPNFKHYPAGEESPSLPRSFVQHGSAAPSSNQISYPDDLKATPTYLSPDLVQLDVTSPKHSPVEYPYDARHPPPLTMVSGQAFTSRHTSLLPHTGSVSTSTFDPAWNVSGLGLVHLPSRQPSESNSISPNDLAEDSDNRRPNSSARSNASSSEVSNYLTPEDFSSGGSLGGSRRSASEASSTSSAPPLATVRFRYIQDENGHHVVTGREGQLTACEGEPIRTPGAVQGFGVLIAVQELEDRLLIRQVSENATELLGLSPQYLFSLECFTDTLLDSQAALLWDNIQFLSDPNSSPHSIPPSTLSVEDDCEQDAPHVFLLSGYGAPGTGLPNETTAEMHAPQGPQSDRRKWTCWVAIHRPQPSPYRSEAPITSHNGVIIMEFELEVDMLNPLYPPPGSRIFAQSKFSPSRTSGVSSPSSSTENHSDGASSSSDSASGSENGTGGNVTDASERTSATSLNTSPSPSSMGTSRPIPKSDVSPSLMSQSQSTDTITPDGALGPLYPHSDPIQKSPLATGLDGNEDWTPSTEEILESTTSRSKPLLALERLRRLSKMPGPIDSNSPGYGQSPLRTRRAQRRSQLCRDAQAQPAGAVGMMDVFAVMAQINEQLGTAPDLDTFLKIVVGLIKDLTQFHRVLAYQFDEAWNGQVVAELVDWSQTHDLYMGLHFPAGDIPAQARELYKLNKVRILYDRDQSTARLVVRSKEDLDPPLNMTHCYLRAMSPIHVQYLKNMGVRASMSVSIMAFGTLWGLVACHSYGGHGMRVSFPVRQMLRLLSQSISRNIERLSYAKRLHTRKLINTISSDNHPTGYIVSNADDLLGLFDADFGILVIGDGAKILGPNQHGQEILIMAEYLRLKRYNSIQVSQAVTVDFPDLKISTGLEVVAGLLYVPLSSGGQDFIAFLRRGQPRCVQWAGKPYKQGNEEKAVLEPRKSFKIWSEKLAGRCRVWTDEQLETAGVLSLVYGKFIEVWRQKESALATTNLTNLLLSNASHEVRTPLNHIINYLEMALNGPLDGETRDNLSQSYNASKSLLFTINDLLDLTRLESGNETSFNEPFDLCNSILDATFLYRKEAERLGIDFQVHTDDAPKNVVGDSRKIKTVVQNLTANALKYTANGSISVRCTTYSEPEGLRASSSTAVEIVVADTGCGIPTNKLESIFREFEQVESSEPKTSAEPGVGLGLAVVARIVEQLGGQLRVESKVDEGSRFSFLIPLSLNVEGHKSGSSTSASGSSLASSFRSRAVSNVSAEREIEFLVEALSSSHLSPSPSPSPAPLTVGASPKTSLAGTFGVTDSSVPVRPVKVTGELIRSHGSTGKLRSVVSRPRIIRSHSSDDVEPLKTTELDKLNLRVLIVEDNDINRKILAKRLHMNGHTVVNTTNGQEGLDRVKSDQEFDCILMDINMPILNGYEASQRIREVERREDESVDPGSEKENRRLSHQLNGRIPIFAVSASLFEQERDKLLDSGMDGWILKPIDFKRLARILTGVTDLEQRERDRYHPGYNWESGGWLSHSRATRSTSKETHSFSFDGPHSSS
ncbi:hypothetical protein E1B28_012592 [Marasmius oreades]|uniref:Phytochrome n=1 Tax=Marasmius oreades TaxID=181124 RepID=A0A9P7RRX2_9AGAR|nr:uncharacterized protein E1B28_012592 [Marasmius oreades]KAG7088619.1 hypothetical protein E1B28_012592 [Marasmius oreades]